MDIILRIFCVYLNILAFYFEYVYGSLSSSPGLIGQVKSLQNIGYQIVEDFDSIIFAIKKWASQDPEVDLIKLVDNHGVPDLETIRENFKIAILKLTNISLDFNDRKEDLHWKLGIFRILGGFIRIIAGLTDLIEPNKLDDKEDLDELDNHEEKNDVAQFNEEFKVITIKVVIESMSIGADGIKAFVDTTIKTQFTYTSQAKRLIEKIVKFIDEVEELVNKFKFLNERTVSAYDEIRSTKAQLKELLKLPHQELFSGSNLKLMTLFIYQMKNKIDQFQMRNLKKSIKKNNFEL